jgi:hypothetical protein
MHFTSAGGILNPAGGNIGTGGGFCARAAIGARTAQPPKNRIDKKNAILRRTIPPPAEAKLKGL